jgi:hypothetical protein
VGDITYCQIEIAEGHRDKLEPFFDKWDFSLNDQADAGLCLFEDAEANYGGQGIREDLEKEGLPFVGYHDDGDDYGALVFAYDGTTYADCAGSPDGLMCIVDDDGEPNKASLQNAREYLAVAKAARALMAAVQPSPVEDEPPC